MFFPLCGPNSTATEKLLKSCGLWCCKSTTRYKKLPWLSLQDALTVLGGTTHAHHSHGLRNGGFYAAVCVHYQEDKKKTDQNCNLASDLYLIEKCSFKWSCKRQLIYKTVKLSNFWEDGWTLCCLFKEKVAFFCNLLQATDKWLCFAF